MKLLNIPKELTTKGERAEYLYGNNPDVSTYDCAVPIGWVQKAQERLIETDNIAGHVVTVYYKDRSVRIMPVTDTGMLALATLASYLS